MTPTGLLEPGSLVRVLLQTCSPADGTWEGADGGEKGGEDGLKDPICTVCCHVWVLGWAPHWAAQERVWGDVAAEAKEKRWRHLWASACCGAGAAAVTQARGGGSSGMGLGRMEEKGAQIGPLRWSGGLKGSSVLAG